MDGSEYKWVLSISDSIQFLLTYHGVGIVILMCWCWGLTVYLIIKSKGD